MGSSVEASSVEVTSILQRNGNPIQPLWNLLLLGIRYPAHLQRPCPQAGPRLWATSNQEEAKIRTILAR